MRRSDSIMGTPSPPGRKATDTSHRGLDLRVLGICTGHGLSALGLALLHYRQSTPNAKLRVDLLHYNELVLHHSIRNPILNLLRDIHTAPTLGLRVNALLGIAFTDSIQTFCQEHSIDIKSIDIIGTFAPGLGNFTLYPASSPSNNLLGWNTVISQKLSSTVAYNFSVYQNDPARRHTSPVAYVDGLLLRHSHKTRACITIDDLVDISFIQPLRNSESPATISRECGPGTLLIDYAIKYCTSNDQNHDIEGQFAARGKVNQGIVDRFLEAYDYLRIRPSPNIAREMFGDHEAQRLIDECLYSHMSETDTVATVTAVTAQNIVKQFQRLSKMILPQGQEVDELFICGPGARNTNIIDFLENELPDSIITKPLDDIGLPGDANEAVCYAHLAFETVLRQATQPAQGTFTATGPLQSEAIGGNVVQGERWKNMADYIRQFSDGAPLRISKDIIIAGNLSNGMETLAL